MARDVNKLINMGLMERNKYGIRAKREIILAFLPENLNSPPSVSA